MKRRILSTGAIAFLVVGFVLGYVANLSFGQHAATAASGPVPATAAATGASIDAAIEQAYGIASKSVVFVNNPGVGTGSGIIYNTKGDIVTNNHVTSGSKNFTVTFSNGKTAPATLVGADSADDLAVIHVNTTGLTPATFAPANSYRVAETVLAIGSPLGLEKSVTSGLISGLNRTEQEPTGAYIPDAIQTSAAINPGNSGGALVALNGQVVGIPTIVQTSDANNTNVQNIGFAIPSSRVTFIANQLVQYGKVVHTGRAYLGVDLGSGATQVTPFGQYGQTTTNVSGAQIQQLSSTGPAARAGMQQSDVITNFNGTTITSASDLLTALAQTKPGQTVNVTINRNGTTHSLRVTLGELPASG